ncbi:MAG: CPBP family intramembrane metalloprotease [Sedimentisphaerales bacterium]|nr:CPBP family intramembrane metalloprotease [Sedimentisphaerales bacterium]
MVGEETGGTTAFYFQPGGFLGKIVNLRSHHAVAFIYYSFIAFGEEFLFRGFLQTHLVCWWGNIKGWLITAVIFAYGHLPYNMFINGRSFLDAVLPSTTLLPIGLLMGFVMLRTRNLIAPLVFHIFVNWATVFK